LKLWRICVGNFFFFLFLFLFCAHCLAGLGALAQ
jgi:hypothetical protein